MNHSIAKYVALCFSMACFMPLLYGQSKTGTTIMQFLLIEPSGKISAMGNSGVAIPNDAMSSYYNPASLGYQRTSNVEFSHNNWIADIAHDYFSSSFQISDASSIGLSVASLSSGNIKVRTVQQPLGTGEQYSVSDYSIGIGFGQKITDKFSAGVQISYSQETVWHNSISVFSINFGTLYQITSDGLLLGASISNFGMKGKFDGRDLRIPYDYDATRYGDNSTIPAELLTEEYSLPVVFRVGCSYPIKLNESNELLFAADAFHPSDNSESISFGGEYTFMKTFSLRGGYQHLFQIDSELGLTMGGGVMWDIANYVLHMDYSWSDQGRLGSSQRITVGMDF